ncbi:MAG: ABC transporter permease [Trueperaceae bacterium]|nr:ABC transporter permease [Trueperaceae bacterium]MCC6309475.1 ABC transporter permease [Trueperaceae bacterium]MCO5174575.1 ABC transporter permease [Trueperaceae bacterium]MCW5820134.1 ABC transporter permease [Trueperaceae bacterium]
MGRYVVRRSLQAVFVILAVLVVTFILLRAIGDPARLLVSPEGSRENLAQIRHALGLDVPLHVQFVRFMADVVKGDFGNSFTFGRPALGLVLERMPATLLLTLVALGLAVPTGMLLGTVSAVRRNSVYDNLATTLAVLGRAVPNFWLSIMLIVVFGAYLKWLPPSGFGTWRHLVLPAVALSAGLAAMVARLTRSSLLEVMGHDFVRTAKAKGLTETRVLNRHVMRNALIPIATVVGLQAGHLLGGAIITETIFAWPGVGRLLTQSIYNYDYPVVQTSVFVISVTFVFLNLAIDLLYALIDPRIRYE